MNTIKHNGRKWMEYRFDNLAEYAAYAESPCDMANNERHSLTNPSSDRWDYSTGLDGAIALVRSGWPEGTRKMREAADAIYERIAPRVAIFGNTEHAVSGASIDIAAYVEGIPECMLEFVETETQAARPVDMLISASFWHGVSADVVCNRGAAILAAIEALDRRGCSVTVTVEDSSGKRKASGSYMVTYAVTLKRPGEIIDTDALAFALMHPAYCRRIGFAAAEHAPAMFRRFIGITGDGTYGGAVSHPEPSACVQFPAIGTNTADYITPEKAVKAVLNILKQHGLTIEDER